jgi:hypothetical protein
VASSSASASSAGDGGPLHETRGGVTVDWAEGTLASSGGAAADLRMPSADLARPGAVRRAREAALAKLRAVLADLPLGGGRTLTSPAVERALARARTGDVQYQSNGGAVARVTVRFSDWIDGDTPPAGTSPAPVATLLVTSMHLSAAPAIKIGKQEAAIGAAQYRLGAPPAGAGAMRARLDRGGRLLLEGDAELAAKLARGLVVIYVEKVLR